MPPPDAWFRNATAPPSPGKRGVNFGYEQPVGGVTIPAIRNATGAAPFVTSTVAAGVAAGRLEIGCYCRLSSCAKPMPRPLPWPPLFQSQCWARICRVHFPGFVSGYLAVAVQILALEARVAVALVALVPTWSRICRFAFRASCRVTLPSRFKSFRSKRAWRLPWSPLSQSLVADLPRRLPGFVLG